MNKKQILENTASYHDEFIESLKDSDEAFSYLQLALEEYQEDNDAEALLVALRNIALAQGGITKLARKTQLNRQNLYNILSKKGNPRLDTFGAIVKGLGFKLAIGH
ncbi:addiction module antidote protein [Legionella sp. CNM-1927-20]|uniref:addiction module antidote protein n=1 Tax=Legionella sp. CNM-1927-20 TaxID=3422221 RepID=UPI00403AC0C8